MRFPALVILYCPTIVPCPDSRLIKLERQIFHFLWKSGVSTCEAIYLLSETVNCCGRGSTATFYSRVVKSEREDNMGETLNREDNQLDSLFQWTFEPRNGMIWQCYLGALPVRDKLKRHGHPCPSSTDCPRCGQGRETILRAIVQCSEVSEM